MEKVKTVLDREPISSETINSKQDFGKVVAGYKALKPPVWKSAWFYGTTGLATLAFVSTAVLYNPSEETTEESPLKTTSTSMEPKKETQSQVAKKDLIAQNIPTKKESSDEQRTNNVAVNTPDELTNRADVELIDRQEIEVQTPPPAPERRRPVNTSTSMMPHINGVFFGDIPYAQLCSQDGIQCNDDLAIISFNIQFYNGRESIEESVKGNVIPFDLCEAISKTSIGNTVSITQIKAEHRVSGRATNLTSMNLVPTIQ